MAWRIEEHVVRGEIDNRTPGKVSGRIWLAGRADPIVLALNGNPWRDLAGHVLEFTNPDPVPRDLAGLSPLQEGSTGDITASRKVKVPDCSMEEVQEAYAARREFPWHWANPLYLEWFSETNGRVVIESATYQLELDSEPAWTMTEQEETAQKAANADAVMDSLARLGIADAPDSVDDDEPQSPEERRAEAEDERMQLLTDRVMSRLEREDRDATHFQQIYKEERARLMRERGETEPELTPEQEDERRKRIEEINKIAAEAIADLEAERWKDEDPSDEHPLLERSCDLAVEIFAELGKRGWVPADAQEEHPLSAVANGVAGASAKLGGALGMTDGDDDWPPDRTIAGNVLVRLKKARACLRDALDALDSADQENLATPEWRHHTRAQVEDILTGIETLIREAREVLDPGASDT